MRVRRRVAGVIVIAVLGSCASPDGIVFPGDQEDSSAPSAASGAPPRDPPPRPTPTATSEPLPDAPLPDPVLDAGPCGALIDDMEHEEGSILSSCGRRGYWYTFNDGAAGGVQVPAAGSKFLPEPIAGARGASRYAAHTSGAGFDSWGAALAFDLNCPGAGAAKGSYDASKYRALTFWARAAGEGGAVSLRVNFPTVDTDPEGGRCGSCNDHFGTALSLGPAWASYTVTFRALAQQGWGDKVPAFESRRVYSVQFQIAPRTTFDVWIDDVAFVE